MNKPLFFLSYFLFSLSLFFDVATIVNGYYFCALILSIIFLFFSICCVVMLFLRKKICLFLLSFPIMVGGGFILDDIIKRLFI